MKKRTLSVLFIALTMTVVSLAGCNKTAATVETKEETPVSEEPEVSADESENMVGMANPMVPVDSDEAFSDQLGIKIDSSYFPTDGLDRYIIGGKLAHVAFNLSDPEGKKVECTFRGTKDDEWAENPVEMIAGIYASDFGEAATTTIPATGNDIEFNTVYSDSEKITVSYFDYEGVHYTLSIDGNVSQMLIAEVNDSVLYAIGAQEFGDDFAYITPYDDQIDINNIDDAMFNASIKNITTDNGVTTADVTLYSMELYDMVDICQMAPGDVISVDGEDIAIASVEDGKPVDFHDDQGPRNVKVVNGGTEEGGVEFIANEGGTYRVFGMDDYASFAEKGTVNLEIAADAEINDTSDLEHQEGIVLTTAELEGLKDKEFDPGFSFLNTKIRIVDNKIVEINRWFTP